MIGPVKEGMGIVERIPLVIEGVSDAGWKVAYFLKFALCKLLFIYTCPKAEK